MSKFAHARIGARLLGAALRDSSLMRMLLDAGLRGADFDSPHLERLWSVMTEHYQHAGSLEVSLVQDGLEALFEESRFARETIDTCLRQEPIRFREELPGLIDHMRRRVANRRLARLAEDLARAVQVENANPVQIAQKHRSAIESILVGASAMTAATGAELAALGERLLHEGEEETERVRLGFPLIDEALGGGAIRGEPTVIGADTGIGKSTFAGHIVMQALADGHRVLWFSLEARRKKITRMLVKMRSGFVYPKKGEKASRERGAALAAAHAWLAEQPLLVEDASGITVEDLRARATLYMHLHDVDTIIVDYAQDISRSTAHGRDDLNYAHISTELRKLAANGNVALIEMSQVSELDKGQKRLGKENTAFTKQFGRDAFAVVMLEGDRGVPDEIMRNVTRLGLVKNRENGKLVDEWMRYLPETGCLHPSKENGELIRIVEASATSGAEVFVSEIWGNGESA
jgi:replicative DNA helicase